LADGDAAGFARADSALDFEFPRDHGAHPDFRTEWWYFTGNVYTREKRHFGFELTFFRYALVPEKPRRESKWASTQIWMAHFAITDTRDAEFHAAERLRRESLDLAGASAASLNVWIDEWSAKQAVPNGPIVLTAKADYGELNLELEAPETIVLQGTDGLDRKGPEPGNASYYYSVPRLGATGTIQVDENEPVAVELGRSRVGH